MFLCLRWDGYVLCDVVVVSPGTRLPCFVVLYVVVDTNVLLTDFECLEYVRNQTTVTTNVGKAVTYATVVIPWIVLCELDGLKNGNKGAPSQSK